MSELRHSARRAALAGALVVKEGRRSALRVNTKSAADFVTQVDLAAEAAIASVLADAHPDHAILGEEGVSDRGAPGGSQHRWVIDPLDGTTNFIRGLPAFAVSVSCEEKGRPVAAAVVDVPRGDLYHAARGQGAELVTAAGECLPLRVSEESGFAGALWLTGIPFRNLEVLPRYLPGLAALAAGSCGIRRFGSAALDLCWLAAGKAEGFWEYGLSRWDISAGALIVEEAGGRVSDFGGGGDYLDTGDIVASNGRLHEVLLGKLVAG